MAKEIDGNRYQPIVIYKEKEIDGNRREKYKETKQEEINGNIYTPPKVNGDKEYGVVRFFNQEKGFGFIKTQDDEDYYMNKRLGISGKIAIGDNVEFIIKKIGDNLKAIKVKKRKF